MGSQFRVRRSISYYFFLYCILMSKVLVSWSEEGVLIAHSGDALQSSNNGSVTLQKPETASQGSQELQASYVALSSTPAQRLERKIPSLLQASSGTCTTSCLNGGACVHLGHCNCSQFRATGSRCQTVPNTGYERDMICRTWGQYSFETFDGLYYYFPGKYTYTLVKDCDPSETSFLIQIHNDWNCNSSPYHCRRSVSLFFYHDREIVIKGYSVLYNGQSIQLPQVHRNVQIERLAGYILVTHHYAFTMAWDGKSGLYIKMSPEFVGKTCGLCGNFNGDLQDDLITSYGEPTDDIAVFANSWKEMSPDKGTGINVPSDYPSPCSTQNQNTLQIIFNLCNALMELPFKACHNHVSPFPFLASCTNDLCVSEHKSSSLCQVLTEYARACSHAGLPLHDWRTHFQQCVVDCGRALIHRECIACCPATCRQAKQCIDNKIDCVDGCYCPEGLIYENGTCVKPSECSCIYHGVSYLVGSVVMEDCNNCTCFGGRWNCTENICPAECSVTGDIHFATFDGHIYTFQATCQYILAKSRTSSKFTVTLQNSPCGQEQDGACIQSVNIILDQDPKKQVLLTQSGDVFVCEQYKVNLPYNDGYFDIQELSSMFIQVKSQIGVSLQYDRKGLRLYLEVDGKWKDDTIGLCGTFNGNIQDDFLSPVGVSESNPYLFGSSWKIPSVCESVSPAVPVDPCDVHLQAAAYAFEVCSVINKGIFMPCHEYVSPAVYYEQCKADACKCGQTCLCSALAHYARQCAKYGIVIDFRQNITDCAIHCPETMTYWTCVSTCKQSCKSISMPEVCSDDCAEGCACPQGTYFNSKTMKCVQRNECTCYFQGAEYLPGEEAVTSLGRCFCKEGMMFCESYDTSCPDGQIYFNCSDPAAITKTDIGRTCENQLLNLTLSGHAPCVSGCVCPEGLVKHGDECFLPEECPCSWKAKEYFPGDQVTSPCHTCTCQHGSFQCTFYPCPSMCTVYGDRHYSTFDDLLFDYIGACKVYLVKSTIGLGLSIIAENVNCYGSGIICRKFLSISIGRSWIVFDDETGKPNPSSLIDKQQNAQIWQAGLYTIIHFPKEHVSIMWDRRTTIHIQVGPQWKGELTGLCGNFDLKTANEMMTPENIDLGNSQDFGNSWTTTECMNSPDVRNPCIVNPLREPFAKKECGILLSDVFETCHPVVDVTWFYSNCLSDTCGCSRGGDCECFCTTVAAYAHRCCQEGILVDWRSPTVCPYDCEYFNKVIGKGPYKLVGNIFDERILAASLFGGVIFLVKENGSFPGILHQFMLTPGQYKSKAHDPVLVSLEAAERPNFFVQAGLNESVVLAKWEDNDDFQIKSTFVHHKDTWITGYHSFESLFKPGFFLHHTASSVHLKKYSHTNEFRMSTLFRLVETDFKSPFRSTCEWRYDACSIPCFRTCKDPKGETCQSVPKTEGCIPFCPPNMVLDEVAQKCVYLEDCIISKDVEPTPAKYITSEPGLGLSKALNVSVSLLTTLPTTAPSSRFSSSGTFATSKMEVSQPISLKTESATVTHFSTSQTSVSTKTSTSQARPKIGTTVSVLSNFTVHSTLTPSGGLSTFSSRVTTVVPFVSEWQASLETPSTTLREKSTTSKTSPGPTTPEHISTSSHSETSMLHLLSAVTETRHAVTSSVTMSEAKTSMKTTMELLTTASARTTQVRTTPVMPKTSIGIQLPVSTEVTRKTTEKTASSAEHAVSSTTQTTSAITTQYTAKETISEPSATLYPVALKSTTKPYSTFSYRWVNESMFPISFLPTAPETKTFEVPQTSPTEKLKALTTIESISASLFTTMYPVTPEKKELQNITTEHTLTTEIMAPAFTTSYIFPSGQPATSAMFSTLKRETVATSISTSALPELTWSRTTITPAAPDRLFFTSERQMNVTSSRVASSYSTAEYTTPLHESSVRTTAMPLTAAVSGRIQTSAATQYPFSETPNITLETISYQTVPSAETSTVKIKTQFSTMITGPMTTNATSHFLTYLPFSTVKTTEIPPSMYTASSVLVEASTFIAPTQPLVTRITPPLLTEKKVWPSVFTTKYPVFTSIAVTEIIPASYTAYTSTTEKTSIYSYLSKEPMTTTLIPESSKSELRDRTDSVKEYSTAAAATMNVTRATILPSSLYVRASGTAVLTSVTSKTSSSFFTAVTLPLSSRKIESSPASVALTEYSFSPHFTGAQTMISPPVSYSSTPKIESVTSYSTKELTSKKYTSLLPIFTNKTKVYEGITSATMLPSASVYVTKTTAVPRFSETAEIMQYSSKQAVSKTLGVTDYGLPKNLTTPLTTATTKYPRISQIAQTSIPSHIVYPTFAETAKSTSPSESTSLSTFTRFQALTNLTEITSVTAFTTGFTEFVSPNITQTAIYTHTKYPTSKVTLIPPTLTTEIKEKWLTTTLPLAPTTQTETWKTSSVTKYLIIPMVTNETHITVLPPAMNVSSFATTSAVLHTAEQTVLPYLHTTPISESAKPVELPSTTKPTKLTRATTVLTTTAIFPRTSFTSAPGISKPLVSTKVTITAVPLSTPQEMIKTVSTSYPSFLSQTVHTTNGTTYYVTPRLKTTALMTQIMETAATSTQLGVSILPRVYNSTTSLISKPHTSQTETFSTTTVKVVQLSSTEIYSTRYPVSSEGTIKSTGISYMTSSGFLPTKIITSTTFVPATSTFHLVTTTSKAALLKTTSPTTQKFTTAYPETGLSTLMITETARFTPQFINTTLVKALHTSVSPSSGGTTHYVTLLSSLATVIPLSTQTQVSLSQMSGPSTAMAIHSTHLTLPSATMEITPKPAETFTSAVTNRTVSISTPQFSTQSILTALSTKEKAAFITEVSSVYLSETSTATTSSSVYPLLKTTPITTTAKPTAFMLSSITSIPVTPHEKKETVTSVQTAATTQKELETFLTVTHVSPIKTTTGLSVSTLFSSAFSTPLTTITPVTTGRTTASVSFSPTSVTTPYSASLGIIISASTPQPEISTTTEMFTKPSSSLLTTGTFNRTQTTLRGTTTEEMKVIEITHLTSHSKPLPSFSLVTEGISSTMEIKVSPAEELTTELAQTSENYTISQTMSATTRILPKSTQFSSPSFISKTSAETALPGTFLSTEYMSVQPVNISLHTISPASSPSLPVITEVAETEVLTSRALPSQSTFPFKLESINATEYRTAEPTAAPSVTSELLSTSEGMFVFSPSTVPSQTPQTCTPRNIYTDNECIQIICMDGHLIPINMSQNCPYNATQPSCGVLGFAVQVNGDKCCPKWECPCRCSIFPDLSFITFDGSDAALFKAASYVISQVENETITIHILDCHNGEMAQWNSTALCLGVVNVTHQSNEVIIDRLNRRLMVNSRYARPKFRKYGFDIVDTGNMYLIKTPAKMQIQWFHSTGTMIIEARMSSKAAAMGLCGYCDGNPANDLTLPNGTVFSKSEDPTAYMDSWQVPNTLQYMGKQRRREVNCSTSDCSDCLGMLLNQTFSSCHPFVPPEIFCEYWVRDAEYVENPCVALTAYVAMCHKFNVCIEWRSQDNCPFFCPPELTYKACLPACEAKTCRDNEFPQNDVEVCSVLTEGCVCPNGTVLHQPYSALCIPEQKCACTDSSGIPRASGETWKASVDGCCLFTCDNDTIIPVEYNCSDIEEPQCRPDEMIVFLAEDKNCCPQKLCVCNQTLCALQMPKCEYGEKLVSYYNNDYCCPDYVCECDPEKCDYAMPNCREDQTLISTRIEGSCCLSFICTCGACSDKIPVCQEGEVLIVDTNITERCCPNYQCVCETQRCSEHSCPIGFSVVEVWSPVQCCPYRTCECACGTIPKPQCGLGEKLVADDEYQNNTENPCGCHTYICVKDQVCLTGDKGVLRPGQTLVEHRADGVCHTVQCTDRIDAITNYYQITVTTTNCTEQCESNQVYEPPPDTTSCCGTCKNMSCVYSMDNGTAIHFQPGTSWTSSCVRYDCINTVSGPIMISSPVNCPPFNETECVKIGGYATPYMDGCCKVCKEDGKFCKKVAVRMTIRKNDCRSNRPVNIVSCDGKCPSASIYNYNINTYARFCKCCREIGLQRRNVALYCTGNSTWVTYSIQEPTDCSCQWS
ncbi:otogelin isoform X2 [Protopterus annectens]|uniref:otogelin isoform X2 n=1 Tax=Protopterus annectens TaxID=7888 RepID=UPI001CFBF78D|nr:otogelin isoform X2 [Protopterus annectens]